MKAAPFAGIVAGLRGERRALVTPAMATTHAGGPGVLMAAWMILEMGRTLGPAGLTRRPA